MNVRINIVELASELAHKKVKRKMERMEITLYQTGENGGTKYTEKAQEEFNDWYDYYHTLIYKQIVYPFKEGETYYTTLKHKDKLYGLHKYDIIESCWDDVSEEMYRISPDKKIFKSKERARAHIESLKYLDQLSNYKDD